MTFEKADELLTHCAGGTEDRNVDVLAHDPLLECGYSNESANPLSTFSLPGPSKRTTIGAGGGYGDHIPAACFGCCNVNS